MTPRPTTTCWRRPTLSQPTWPSADYKKLNQMLIDDVAYIPLFYANGSFLFKPYVRGAGTNNFFDYHWNEIQLLTH